MFILNKIDVFIVNSHSFIVVTVVKMSDFCSFNCTLIVSAVEFSQLAFHAFINILEFKYNFVVYF